MIEQLISRSLAIRNTAHLAHWKTDSYAEHVALGDFYDGIVDLLDKLVEAYQGFFGLIGDVNIPATKTSTDIVKALSVEAAWINVNREEIAKEVSALENIVDEISGLYLTTLYKLKNLS